MVTKIRPLGDNVVVEVDEQEKVTPGGIHLPDASREAHQSVGRVIAVGRGARQADGAYATPEIKEGDRVLFLKYAGTAVEGQKNLKVMKAENIVGIVEEFDQDVDAADREVLMDRR
jgi:chaperonin GroES